MNFQDQGEDIIRKVFGFQKVKLYEIEHFIFDFGGVLIKPTHSIKNLFDIIEHDLNIAIPRTDNSYYRKLFRQVGAGIITSRDFIENVLKRYYYLHKKNDGALQPKTVNVDYYLELWFQLYSKFSHLSIDMEEIVHQLHKAGYTVSLMSNTFDVHVKSNKLKGFYNLFDHIFLSNEIGLRKPDLEKYKHVIKKLKTKPKYCIFIDNKLKNLIPAKQLGMNVIKFESIDKFKEQLKELGIKDISSLSRRDIKNKYKLYKKIKREFRKAKRAYKKAKNNYLKTKKNSSKKKTDLELKYEDYLIKKAEYKKAKLKKKELVSRIKVN
ncbi:MAG: HAD family hydrolase [Candidatus Thorarchaeota archaeon]